MTKAFIIPVAHICVSFCKLLQFHILFVILFQKAKTIFSVLLSLDLHLVKTYITKITLRIMFAHHNRHKVLFFCDCVDSGAAEHFDRVCCWVQQQDLHHQENHPCVSWGPQYSKTLRRTHSGIIGKEWAF